MQTTGGCLQHSCPFVPDLVVMHTCSSPTPEAFDFASYMKGRAHLVNQALDECMPARYPEVLTEAMRWVGYVLKVSLRGRLTRATSSKEQGFLGADWVLMFSLRMHRRSVMM